MEIFMDADKVDEILACDDAAGAVRVHGPVVRWVPGVVAGAPPTRPLV